MTLTGCLRLLQQCMHRPLPQTRSRPHLHPLTISGRLAPCSSYNRIHLYTEFHLYTGKKISVGIIWFESSFYFRMHTPTIYYKIF